MTNDIDRAPIIHRANEVFRNGATRLKQTREGLQVVQADRLADEVMNTEDLRIALDLAWQIEGLKYLFGDLSETFEFEDPIDELRRRFRAVSEHIIEPACGIGIGDKDKPAAYWATLYRERRQMQFALDWIEWAEKGERV